DDGRVVEAGKREQRVREPQAERQQRDGRGALQPPMLGRAFCSAQAEHAIQRRHQAHRSVLQMIAAYENAAVATSVTTTTVQPLARIRFGSKPYPASHVRCRTPFARWKKKQNVQPTSSGLNQPDPYTRDTVPNASPPVARAISQTASATAPTE